MACDLVLQKSKKVQFTGVNEQKGLAKVNAELFFHLLKAIWSERTQLYKTREIK